MNKEKARELVFYLIFGVLTTLVSWISYILFVNGCGFSVDLANVLSWIASVTFAFITNKLWVFDSKSFKITVVIKEVLTFISSRIVTGVIEIFGVPMLSKTGFDNIFYNFLSKNNISIKVLFTDGLYSKVSFAVIVVILNYVFSKLFVFKKKVK